MKTGHSGRCKGLYKSRNVVAMRNTPCDKLFNSVFTRAANSVDFYIEFKFKFEFSLFYEFEFDFFIFAGSNSSSSSVKICQVFSEFRK